MADIRREQSAEGETVVLGGELTITHMGNLKTELLAALRNASQVRVRFENVREIDMAFLQILCSAHRTAADQNKSLTLGGDLNHFRNIMKGAGFQRHIGCREESKYPCLWLCQNNDR